MRRTALALIILTLALAPLGVIGGIAPASDNLGLSLPEGTPWGGIAEGTLSPTPMMEGVVRGMIGEVSPERLTSELYTFQGFGSRVYRAPGMYNCSDYLFELGSDLGLGSEYNNFTVDRGSLGIYDLSNIIWTMPGTNASSDRIYYIYAHSDSVQRDNSATLLTDAPGADDDASGCAAVIECARVLSRYDLQDTIVFAFFNAEEIGLVGSAVWADEMLARDQNVSGGIDLDMIGYSSGTMEFDLDLIYNADSSPQASDLITANRIYGIGLRILPTQTTSSIPSDIQSMYNHGYTGVFAIEEDFNPYYHTTADTVDKLNITLVERCTKMSVATLSEWARLEVPDAGLESFDVRPYPLEGADMTVDAVVVNDGNTFLSNVTVEFRSDGEAFSLQTVNLSSGERLQLSAAMTAEIGVHNISVHIDPTDRIAEIDERNNTAWMHVETNDRPRSVLTVGENPVLTDQPVLLNGSGSFDGVGGPLVFRFILGDGVQTGWSYDPTFIHSYPGDGTYNVSLIARDSLGIESAPSTVALSVLNRGPSVDPSSGKEHAGTFDPIVFLSHARDPDGTVGCLWDFGDGATSTEMDPVHEYNRSGFYEVTVLATDDDGATAEGHLLISIDDSYPICTLNVSSNVGNISTEFSFNSQCWDRDGEIASYEWDLGDGTTSALPNLTHRYDRPGSYVVRLEVRDDSGNEARAKVAIIVVDLPPGAVGSADETSIMSGDPVSFNGSGSYDLEGALFYRWDFGDGSLSPHSSPTHIYTDPGSYTPKLRVTDTSGQTAEFILPEIKVGNRAPGAEFATYGVMKVNVTVYFDGSGSSDVEGPVALSWRLGNGEDKQGTMVSTTYSVPGTYTVNLTVTDQDGGISYSQRSITITEDAVVVPPAGEDDGNGSLMMPILIVTNVFWSILVILLIAFFVIRSRRETWDE